MREILFRGQTRRNGEKVWMNGEKVPGRWVYGGVLQGVDAHSIIYGGENADDPSEGLNKWPVYTDTLGQYTGLTDMQGVKIFEGDVVTMAEEYGKIEYSETEAMFQVVFDTWCTDFDHYFGTDFEVVGNIHDNPELIGGGEA